MRSFLTLIAISSTSVVPASAPAKFPHHKDFATFDFGAAAVSQTQIEPYCSGQFTGEAHNLILVGGTGTGKTHIAIALGTTLINNGKKAFGMDFTLSSVDIGRIDRMTQTGYRIIGKDKVPYAPDFD
ncbi:MAG: ATP-binding protein [Paracoccus sp. (in: a-proteobacteria)]